MRVLVHRVKRSSRACGGNEREGYTPASLGRGCQWVGIDLLDRAHNQGTDGRAGLLGALFEALVEGFGQLNGGSGRHVVIMHRSHSSRKNKDAAKVSTRLIQILQPVPLHLSGIKVR